MVVAIVRPWWNRAKGALGRMIDGAQGCSHGGGLSWQAPAGLAPFTGRGRFVGEVSGQWSVGCWVHRSYRTTTQRAPRTYDDTDRACLPAMPTGREAGTD